LLLESEAALLFHLSLAIVRRHAVHRLVIHVDRELLMALGI
jgi:hypothetical protein